MSSSDSQAPRRFLAPLFLALVFLGACATEPPPRDFPEIGFAHLAPIQLDVGTIEVERLDRPSGQPPRVDHLFPNPPGEVAETWARERLEAAAPGSANTAQVLIREASVIEVPLPRTPGIKGAFTTDQSERYDAKVAIDVRIFDAYGNFLGNAEAEALRSLTLPENATLGEREDAWFRMTETLFRDLDRELENNIRSALYSYVLN